MVSCRTCKGKWRLATRAGIRCGLLPWFCCMTRTRSAGSKAFSRTIWFQAGINSAGHSFICKNGPPREIRGGPFVFHYASDLQAGSAPPVSIMALAALAGLGQFVPVVVGLTAVGSVTIDIVVQAGFPLFNIPSAAVVIVRMGHRGSA